MVVNCELIWSEVSNYLDGDVDPALRAAIEDHLRGCQECKAVVDGTRNVIQLYGDERLLEVPRGFSERMEQRLNASMPAPLAISRGKHLEGKAWTRRGFLGWASAAAAAMLLAGVFEINKLSSSRQMDLRSQHAQPAAGVPPDMQVVVSVAGKIFHRPGCEFILAKEKTETMTAREAMQKGFSPCVRCLKKYLLEEASKTTATG